MREVRNECVHVCESFLQIHGTHVGKDILLVSEEVVFSMVLVTTRWLTHVSNGVMCGTPDRLPRLVMVSAGLLILLMVSCVT